jgi:hypothetical protein
VSHSTVPTSPSAANRPACPPWCDPRYCRVTPRDICHESTPVRVDTTDAGYDLNLTRTDDLTHPETWDRPPTLQLHVESNTLAPDGSDGRSPLFVVTDLAPAEVLPLIGALAALHSQAGAS